VASIRIRFQPMRIVVILSGIIVGVAAANIVLHARYPLNAQPGVVVTTIARYGCELTADHCVTAIAFDDHDGNLYGTDLHNQIVRIAPNGTITPIAGSPYDEDRCSATDGKGTAAGFCDPTSIAYDAQDHTMIVADIYNGAIRKVTEDGRVTTIAAPRQASASRQARRCWWDFTFSARHVCHPEAVTVDPRDGSILVVQGQALMRLHASGRYELVAGADPLGADLSGCFGHDGAGMSAVYCGLEGVAAEPDGTIFLSETMGNVVNAVSRFGVSSAWVGTRRPYFGSAASSFTPELPIWPVLRLVPQPFWEWSLGCPQRDGPLPSATFCRVESITNGGRGILFVAEPYANSIRQIDLRSGKVSTITANSRGDDCGLLRGAAREATVCQPDSLTFDARHRILYFLDFTGVRRLKLS
jgi:hypothetical protein